MVFPNKVKKLAQIFLNSDAETSSGVRRDIEAAAANFGGSVRQVNSIPYKLRFYVEKIACTPYKVTDTDIIRLRAAGYSEDEIFEITLAAALGAGMARLEAGLQALDKNLQIA